MSTTTINGLRFRRVALVSGKNNREIFCTAKSKQVCAALICRRCTAVLVDSEQAARHVCVPFDWLRGVLSADVESMPLPQKARERVRVVNGVHMTNLWPHGMKVPKPHDLAPLDERYETLSVLVAELAKMEREIARREVTRKKARRR
jgi:hypothetical protein